MEGSNQSKGMLVFTVVWIGQLFSTLGSGLTSFAMGIWIYEETGSATLFVVNILVASFCYPAHDRLFYRAHCRDSCRPAG